MHSKKVRFVSIVERLCFARTEHIVLWLFASLKVGLLDKRCEFRSAGKWRRDGRKADHNLVPVMLGPPRVHGLATFHVVIKVTLQNSNL